ncbi:MAG: hypothetical protein U0165_01430 [Polyangiaceae bacterium]
MKPSYDDDVLNAYFKPLSAELWDDPIIGPVLRELERSDRVLIDAVADVDRSPVRDALQKLPDQRLGEASAILEELGGWRSVPG